MTDTQLKTEIQKLNLKLHSQREKLTRAECAFLLEVIRKQVIAIEIATEYIGNYEVVHKKMKNDIPTVIEYQGKRYVLTEERMAKL